MQIQIKNSEEFHSLLTVLLGELVDARIHLTLYKDLVKSYEEYAVEFGQSWTFWSLTLSAHLDAVHLRLCKAYDQYEKSNPTLNLRNLLHTIEANLHLFDEPNFRERLKGNPFVDSLAEGQVRPDPAQLAADVARVSSSDARVRKLIVWRNNFFAHRSPDDVLNRKPLAINFPISLGDIEALVNDGIIIANRYSILFNATSHASGIIGSDDYLNVLKAVREHVQNYKRQIEEERKRLSVANGR